MAKVIEKVRINEKKLTNFALKVFVKVGVPEEDARIVSHMLVNTEKRGVVTHGLARLGPWYARPVLANKINGKANIQTLNETVSTAVLDGDRGLGFVVGNKAMNIAMEKARATGIGNVVVRNVGHFGAAFNYPLIASKKGMIGFCMTNTPPWMAAPGTGTPAVGTNPLSFAAPAGEKADFLLDMSCTVVAAAKALREDLDIPEGWLIDKEGNSIREQSKIVMGVTSLLPLGSNPSHGSFKGYGLGIMVEILTAILSGTSCGLLHFQKGGTTWSSFFGSINIEAFIQLDRFKAAMDEMIDTFENIPNKLPGVDKLFIPGGHSEEIVKDCEVNGIPLAKEVIEDHRKLAQELSLEIDY